MKHEKLDVPIFIPYDDNNMEHVMAGPDYGQPNSSSTAWTELQSKEYTEFVREISSKILKNPPLNIVLV